MTKLTRGQVEAMLAGTTEGPFLSQYRGTRGDVVRGTAFCRVVRVADVDDIDAIAVASFHDVPGGLMAGNAELFVAAPDLARALLAAWDREAKLREATMELVEVSARAIGLSQQYADFKLYAMEPMHAAISAAVRALGDTQ